jgi:hypothetical protein
MLFGRLINNFSKKTLYIEVIRLFLYIARGAEKIIMSCECIGVPSCFCSVNRFPEIYWLDFSEEAGTNFVMMVAMVFNSRQISSGLSNQRG